MPVDFSTTVSAFAKGQKITDQGYIKPFRDRVGTGWTIRCRKDYRLFPGQTIYANIKETSQRRAEYYYE
jgi:hypothetical protein